MTVSMVPTHLPSPLACQLPEGKPGISLSLSWPQHLAWRLPPGTEQASVRIRPWGRDEVIGSCGR